MNKTMTEVLAERAIPERILDEAALWLMELHSGQLDPARRQQLTEWCARSADHERAWQRASIFSNKMQQVSPAGARALKSLAAADRRKAVKTIAALLLALPVGWLAYRYTLQGEGMRYRTALGERREVTLDDGTQLVLNTDTEVDVVFNDAQRRLILRQGEILVTTAKDQVTPPRSFSVQVREGSIRALGTRFTVWQQDAKSQVAVMEGAIEISPLDAPTAKTVLPSQRQATFNSKQADTPVALDAGAASWEDGMLIAHKMPLATFLAQLDRYRPGKLQYDKRVANLPVSGAFSLTDTDQTLATLEQTMPVRINYLTRYWVTVVPH